MECLEARSRFSDLFDGELPPAEEALLRGHLEACATCQRGYREFGLALGDLHRYEAPVLAPGFEQQVLRRLEGVPAPTRRGRLLRLATPFLAGVAVATIVFFAIPESPTPRPEPSLRGRWGPVIMTPRGFLASAGDVLDLDGCVRMELVDGQALATREGETIVVRVKSSPPPAPPPATKTSDEPQPPAPTPPEEPTPPAPTEVVQVPRIDEPIEDDLPREEPSTEGVERLAGQALRFAVAVLPAGGTTPAPSLTAAAAPSSAPGAPTPAVRPAVARRPPVLELVERDGRKELVVRGTEAEQFEALLALLKNDTGAHAALADEQMKRLLGTIRARHPALATPAGGENLFGTVTEAASALFRSRASQEAHERERRIERLEEWWRRSRDAVARR